MPAGLFQAREGAPVQNAAYLYARGQWAAPWLALPALKVRWMFVQLPFLAWTVHKITISPWLALPAPVHA